MRQMGRVKENGLDFRQTRTVQWKNIKITTTLIFTEKLIIFWKRQFMGEIHQAQ